MSYPKNNIFVNLLGDADLRSIMLKMVRSPDWQKCIAETDSAIYHNMRRWYTEQDTIPMATIDEWRGYARIKEFRDLFAVARFKPRGTYLDFGAGSAVLSSAIGKSFQLQTYATDMQCWHGKDRRPDWDNVSFEYLIGGKIPFDMQFDIISCLMVLHHLDPQKVDDAIADIKSHLEPAGIFILREHDSRDDKDADLIHIEHAMHDTVFAGRAFDDFCKDYQGNYQSTEFWIAAVKRHGFRLIIASAPKCVNRYTYMVFRLI